MPAMQKTPHRILCSDAILTRLKDGAARPLCPRCQKHTKLYRLGGDRRKCSVCNKTFTENGPRHQRRLRQIADILLCFCLDFPALRASEITGYRQPTVDLLYRKIRQAIADEQWGVQRIRLSSTLETTDRAFLSAFCKRCHKRPGCRGRICRDAPVFGVRIEKNGGVRLDPLSDEPILRNGMYVPPIVRSAPKDPYAQYNGFICHGTFHRFSNREDDGHMRDGGEQFWSWAQERLHRYHGIRTENLGMYLKELEWKYNHRAMDPLDQALTLIPLLPKELLQPRTRIGS